MRELALDEQYNIYGGFTITPDMIEALVKLGICVAGAIKLLMSKKGRIKVPLIEIEWSLNHQDADQVMALINRL